MSTRSSLHIDIPFYSEGKFEEKTVDFLVTILNWNHSKLIVEPFDIAKCSSSLEQLNQLPILFRLNVRLSLEEQV